jgi:WD40 repeat protein
LHSHIPKLGWEGSYAISGGNDSKICVWKTKLPDKQAILNFVNAAKKAPTSKGKTKSELVKDPTPPLVEYELIYKIDHSDKINWITTSPDAKVGNLFVADTSNDVTVYRINVSK